MTNIGGVVLYKFHMKMPSLYCFTTYLKKKHKNIKFMEYASHFHFKCVYPKCAKKIINGKNVECFYL